MRATPRPKQKQGAVSFDKLEPSKENIQPLLRSAGKRMHSLAQNLQQTPKALTEKQERERRQWECALRRDTSNDPLSLWLKYIKWTKLNFSCPTNQKAQLLPLIERCTRKFKEDQRYTNNKHYIKLWLEYAHLSRDSMEVFKFLHANKIGANLALFWRGWAIVAEQNNQFDLVDRIFTAAKNMNAQPIKDITRSYDAFLARMKKKISKQNIEVINQLQHTQSTRPTLGQMNEAQPIGSYRKNHSKPHGFGDIKTTQNNTNNGNNFGVYCDGDENNPNMSQSDINLPPVHTGWRNLGSQYNRSKENDGIPTAWNKQGFGDKNQSSQQTRQETSSTFAIPMDDELRCNKAANNTARGHSLWNKTNFSVHDKLCHNPLANYDNPKDANDPNLAICTHLSRAMGVWSQQGRYLCASFVDPKLLAYGGEISSLEEARCRRMKPKWRSQMEEEEKDTSDNMEIDSDDMMMTVSVGKILYNKNNPDLSIPSTIKEEPLSTKSNILTNNNEKNKNLNRKRKNSDGKLDSLSQAQPSKKRFKLTQNAHHGNLLQPHDINEEHTYDVFAELTTTNFTNNTIQSHYETPLRRLDFATPNVNHISMRMHGIHGNISSEATQEISSMTEFFKNPIKISDKRMCDTPTVLAAMNKSRLMNPTATVTFHSKAAMNDIVKIFGAQSQKTEMDEDDDAIMNNDANNNANANDNGFGIYEETQTVHTQIDLKPNSKNNYEDTQTIHTKIDIGSIQLDTYDNDVPNAEILCLDGSGDGDDGVANAEMLCVDGDGNMDELELIIDPFDADTINKYESMVLRSLLDDDEMDLNIMDGRDTSPPVLIDNLLSGETDIELDDDNDVYLNVTEYICNLSNNEHYIFVVNDLSQEDDTERMLLIDYPLSLRSCYITKILKQNCSNSISHMFSFVESVYLYSNSSFTLCKMTDNFKTLNDILLKANETSCELHEKLLLYYITEILKIVSHLHENNIIHSNLNINSFLVKLSECNSISTDWTNNMAENNENGWHNFGLLLHDINNCIKLDDCIEIEENVNDFGCLIDEKNLNNNNISCMFQKFINHKAWCYEVDHFSIFVIILQLLTQTNEENIISEILNNVTNGNDVIKYIENYRNENGLTKLQNGKMWNDILEMLLMKDNDNDIYEFNKLSIFNRRNYLKQCYEHCAEQLVDLENLSPKLQIILARLDRMIQT